MKRLPAIVAASALLAAAIHTAAPAGAETPGPRVTYQNGMLCISTPQLQELSCTRVPVPDELGIEIVPSVTYDETEGVCYSVGASQEPRCTGPVQFSKPVVTYDPDAGVCVQPSPSAQARCTGKINTSGIPSVSYDSVNGFCVQDSGKSTCTGAIKDRLDDAMGTVTYDDENGACIQPTTTLSSDVPLCTGPVPDPTMYDAELPNVSYSTSRGVCVEMRTFTSADHCSGPLTSSGPALNLTFRNPSGGAMSGAHVAVYVLPFDPPPTYVPARLATGRASASGSFSVPISPRDVKTGLGLAQDDVRNTSEFNVLVEAVDPAKQWLVSSSVITSLIEDTTITLTANVDLPSAVPDIGKQTYESLIGISQISCTAAEDPDGGDPLDAEIDYTNVDPTPELPGSPCPPDRDEAAGQLLVGCSQCVVDTTRRWQRVARFHSAPGIRGTFSMKKGRETRAEAAMKYSGSDWSAGGWMVESEARSASREIGAEGTHRTVLARYRWNKYRIDHTQCPECSKVIEHRWHEEYWTLGLRFAKAQLDQPPFDQNHEEPMQASNDRIVRDYNRNWTFGFGLQLMGLQLGTQVGYSKTTSHVWESVPGCSAQRYLYGDGQDVINATTVYATCR